MNKQTPAIKPTDRVYKIYRMYQRDERWVADAKLIKTGLTEAEAQAWCRNTESSSKTCTHPESIAHTEKFGPWMDGYDTK
jgi:hypothetical protein